MTRYKGISDMVKRNSQGNGSAGKRAKIPKSALLAEIEDDIASEIVRLNRGAAEQPPVVRDLVQTAMRLGQQFKETDFALDAMINALTADDRAVLSLNIFSNNGTDDRFRTLSSAFFAGTYDQLYEVEKQVQKSRELPLKLTKYGAYKQFGDEFGQMSWTKLVAKLNGTAMDV